MEKQLNNNKNLASFKHLNKQLNGNCNAGNKKHKDITQELISKLVFEDFEPEQFSIKYNKSIKKKQLMIEEINLDLLQQIRYKFILNHKNNYSNNELQVNKLDWEDIFLVNYFESDFNNVTCSICLDRKLLSPVITRCGHIYCWPCILNYVDYYYNDKENKAKYLKAPKCPLCKQEIYLEQLKFCDLLQSVNYNNRILDSTNNSIDNFSSSTNYITFNLIMKGRKGVNLYNTYYDYNLENFKNRNLSNKLNDSRFIPIFEQEQEFNFSRIFNASYDFSITKLETIKAELELALKEEVESNFRKEERSIFCINRCLDLIKEKLKFLKVQGHNSKNNSSNNNNYSKLISSNEEGKFSNIKNDYNTSSSFEKNQLELKSFNFFYQEQFGDVFYLHPLNYDILLHEYKTEEELPIDLSVKTIIDIFIFIGQDLRNRTLANEQRFKT